MKKILMKIIEISGNVLSISRGISNIKSKLRLFGMPLLLVVQNNTRDRKMREVAGRNMVQTNRRNDKRKEGRRLERILKFLEQMMIVILRIPKGVCLTMKVNQEGQTLKVKCKEVHADTKTMQTSLKPSLPNKLCTSK